MQVPSLEEALRLRSEGSELKEVEPGTFLPMEGDEKGILHHHFTKDELAPLLSRYSLLELTLSHEHYCVKARKNRNP